MRGDAAAVRTLLKDGADVNAAQGDGMTALHWAARQGSIDTVRILLFAGGNVRATTRLGGYTPLLLASQSGHAPVIEALIKAGADAKSATAQGATTLMMASAAGRPDAIKVLLDAGADIHAKEPSRQETALMFAVAANRLPAMKLLIAAGADIRARTKVVDLKAQTNPDEEEFLRTQQAQLGAGAGRGPATNVQAMPGARATPAPGAGLGGAGRGGRGAGGPDVAGLTRQFRFAELVSAQGGLTPLHFAARQGYADAAALLIESGADVNQVTGDNTTPLLMALINGHFDLARRLLDRGADPRRASDNGVTPLYAVLNVQWAPKTLYPQPRAYTQQVLSHLDMLRALLDRGVDVNARLKQKVWYSGYNFDLSGVDEIGATPFWRAAYASDVDAMRLLVAHDADPNIPTIKPAGRPRTGDAGAREGVTDVSGLPAAPTGGFGVPPLHAASGVGYGEGYAANSHRNAPSGWMPGIKYLVEELAADVNAKDHEGNTALHHAAARGDNEVIVYLVSKGADVKAVNRAGETTLDMANGPVQRIQPFPETMALLEKLGAKNNNRCKSC
ncbi:MAG: ankyrin repeat domain-containing protein [Acidobacteriota bacterium]|nr:ankyrin repeat domain-containing protein [Acidobacteriota bacterium]